MPIQQIITECARDICIWTDDAEPQAVEQLKNIARLPFVHHHVAAMADCHAGSR